MTDLATLAARLREEARRAHERRLVVLHGPREATYEAASTVLEAADLAPAGCVLVGDRDVPSLPFERVAPVRAGDLMGTTQEAVVFDAHDALRPNALGRTVGAVDGGGLYLLLAPPLDAWPDRRDGFDEGLAVPPHDVEEVAGRFRARLVDTLRAHPGVAVVDAGSGTVERTGLTDPAPRTRSEAPDPPPDGAFPDAAYEACLTPDQWRTLRALEALVDPGGAVVVTADRGRGKSSACGLAAGALAANGWDILVTAPAPRNAAEVFARAREVLADLDALETDRDPRQDPDAPEADLAPRDDPAAGEGTVGPGDDPAARAGGGDEGGESAGGAPGDDADGGAGAGAGGEDLLVASDAGGRVRYAPPAAAADDPGDPDALVVDEAAALPVRLLEDLLAADAPAAYATTIHGYEGAGRGFSVRFRDRLEEADVPVRDASLDEPIRYAAGDPVEVWAFRALLLDARPAVDALLEDAKQGTVAYERWTGDDLAADENLLREAFGLLVLAHYRTEPDDLARTLDAPNVHVRGLVHEGRVASVALLAREGGLGEDRRRRMYEGERVRGNMIPDVLTSQLRDPEAGAPEGLRVLRIATHPAIRGRGLGSLLLRRVREELDPDWFGVGYGATPELLRFWRRNGYRTVHLSTTRNERSGEYSAIMLDPVSPAGQALHERSARWFVRRIASVLSDSLDDLDPDVAREALRAVDAAPQPDLDDRDRRLAASAAYGPGLFDVAPRPFRELAVAGLVDDAVDLDPEAERLLVRKPLQAWDWDDVADDLGYPSRRTCMKAFGDACKPLVDAYGGEVAREEARRYR